MSDEEQQKGENVQSASFEEFIDEGASSKIARNLEILKDIPLRVHVELGQTKMSVEETLQLTKGSVIELNKLAGEPVGIYVNHNYVANGEVVVVDEQFGVRVSEVLVKKPN